MASHRVIGPSGTQKSERGGAFVGPSMAGARAARASLRSPRFFLQFPKTFLWVSGIPELQGRLCHWFTTGAQRLRSRKELEKENMDKKPAAGYVDMERKGMPGADGDEGQDQGSEGQCRSRSMGSYRAARDFQSLRRGEQGSKDLQCQPHGGGDCSGPATPGPEEQQDTEK